MNSSIRTLAAAAAVLAACAAYAQEEDEEDADEAPVTFERYRSIIDRYPFGVPPPNFDPTAAASAGASTAEARAAAKTERELTMEENKLKASVRLCAFNLTPERRVMVGFIDNSRKPPQSYYMTVGDTRDGWTVKSADVDARTATVEKDGVEVDLEFAKPGAGGQKTPAAGGAGGRTGVSHAGLQGGSGGSALDRLRERRAQMAKNLQEEEERRKAVAEKENADKAAAAEERERLKQELIKIQEELDRQRKAHEAREQQKR